MEQTALDRILSDAFRGGECLRRELRLSDEDARLLAAFPSAAVESMGEQWYQVTFKGAITGER